MKKNRKFDNIRELIGFLEGQGLLDVVIDGKVGWKDEQFN